MKTTLPFFIACVLLLHCQFGISQENKNKFSVYISGGTTLAAGKTKDSLFIGNGWQVEAGAYLPLFSLPVKAQPHLSKGFSMGIETSINYARQSANGSAAVYTGHFPSQDAALQPGFEDGTPRASIFQFVAGPKAQLRIGKIYFSPAVLLGYFSLHTNAYTLSQTMVNPKQNTESRYIPFIVATGYSASGFALAPKIELGYQLSPQWAVFGSAAICFGPSITNSFTYWKPKGNGSTADAYSYDQFAAGSAIATTTSSHWRTSSIGLGLRYTLIKHKRARGLQSGAGALSQGASMQIKDSGTTTMPNRLSMTPTTARQTQGSNFGEKVASGLQSGAGALSQGASMQIKDSGTTTMPNRLSMTPTTARQTQGNNFGEKVAGGLQSGAGALSQGASLQIKDSGTTTMPNRLSMTPTTARQTQGSNFGEKVSSGLQSGAGALSQGASMQIKDSGTTTMPNRLSMTPTTARQTQGSNFGEKVAGGLQSGAGTLSQGASLQIKDSGTTTMPNRLSMTPTTARQTQGNNFGEKVAGGLQSGAGALSQGASLQIKDSGTTTMPNRLSMTPTTARQTQGSNFGEKVASGLQSGAGALSQGASLQIKDSGTTTIPNRLSMTPTTARQTQGMNFGEKATGKPMPGVVVKGGLLLHGKGYDGEKTIDVVSDANGVITLDQLEAGTYQFTLTANTGKPLKGVIVKGDGNSISILSNANGVIQFTIREAGDYTLVLQKAADKVRRSRHETAKNSISNVR
ncbi:MAG: hypothetical protein QM726_10260 [Chitinophagaceae bacterium]